MIRPCVSLTFLIPLCLAAQTRDRNPFASEKDIAEGHRLYILNCRTCHGDNGERGDRSARLASKFRRHGGSDREMFHTISNGVPGTAMPGSFLEEDSIWKILAFIRTLEEKGVSEHDDPVPLRTRPMPKTSPVTAEQLLHPERIPDQWLMYSGNYGGHRFSPLAQITPANAARLELKWVFQRQVKEKVETTPLVVEGVMYVTIPPNDAYALDAETGEIIWEYKRNLPSRNTVHLKHFYDILF